ncbi:MAG: dihydroorotate dehydrogenase [Acidimicrobiales bacterium]
MRAPLPSRSRVDLRTRVGSVELANPVMTASGTSGHGAELAAYVDLGSLGAVVVKSVAAEPWPGNPAPRLLPLPAGMLNSVGLQGPGVAAWAAEALPALEAAGATVVVSVWGTSVDAFRRAGRAVAAAVTPAVVAVEANVSCPNVEDRRLMFAHSPESTAGAIAAVVDGLGGARPVWAKLSPNVTDLTVIAGAALDAGAEAVTLVNTLMGLALDPATGRPRLGGGGGGLSGPALHPVAVRAVHDVRAAFPSAPIVGVGGVRTGEDAAELMAAGADAVQVGTATFVDPRAPARVLDELAAWCTAQHLLRLDDLKGRSHA